MNLKFVLSHVVLALALIASPAATEDCGGVLEGEYGHFHYAPLDSEATHYIANSCVWIIHAIGAESVLFTLEELEGENATVIIYHHTDLVSPCAKPVRFNASSVEGMATLRDDMLLVVATPQVTGMSFTWDSTVGNESLAYISSTDFVQSSEGNLGWRPHRELDRFIWIVDSKAPSLVQWTARADLQMCDTEKPCKCLYFGAFQLGHDGDVVDLTRTCGRSVGEVDTSAAPIIVIGSTTTGKPGNTQIEISWSSSPQGSTTTMTPTTQSSGSTTSSSSTTVPEPELPPMHIFMATYNGLKAFSFNISEVSLILNGSAEGIAYDPRNKKVYASWLYSIRRANADGSDVETVFSSEDYADLSGLSIDDSTGNLYVATYSGCILVCNTSASNLTCTPILYVGTPLYGNPALDLRSGAMYFTSYSIIWRAGMDGSALTAMVNDTTSNPKGITVDLVNSKLYWADFGASRIQSSNLDGQNVTTLVQLPSASNPYGILKVENRIYWGSWGTSPSSLRSCDSSGQDLRTHNNGTNSIYNLAAVSNAMVGTTNL